jgi:predicted nucleic acid-binding protein
VWALIDSNVYIGHWESGSYTEPLEQVRRAYVVRHSSVVLSELRRGARTRDGIRTVERLRKLAGDVWAPTGEDWWEAGALIRSIGDAEDWDGNKRRAFQNDTLIALTARRHGATIVTANHDDFRLLSRRLRVAVLAV